MTLEKYKLIDYFDVWYTDEEGYSVNNMAEVGTVELKDYTSNNELINKLIDLGFLKHDVTPSQIDVWNDYEMIELYNASTGEPIGRLELIS